MDPWSNGLLTTHLGSAHDGGEAPGGQSSLRQGAGIGLSGCPDLGIAVAAEQRKISRKGFCLEGFGTRGKYRPKGGAKGGPGRPGGHLERTRASRSTRAPGCQVAPLALLRAS